MKDNGAALYLNTPMKYLLALILPFFPLWPHLQAFTLVNWPFTAHCLIIIWGSVLRVVGLPFVKVCVCVWQCIVCIARVHDIFTDLIFLWCLSDLPFKLLQKNNFWHSSLKTGRPSWLPACDYQTVSALTGRAGYTEYSVIELNYICHLAVSLVIK